MSSKTYPNVLPCPFCGKIPDVAHHEAPDYIDGAWCHSCSYFIDLDLFNTRHESGELPEWLKEKIESLKTYHLEIFEKYKEINDNFHTSAMIASSICQVLDLVLSFRKEDSDV